MGYMTCMWIIEAGQRDHIAIGTGNTEDECRESVVGSLPHGDEIAMLVSRDPDHSFYGPGMATVITR